MADARILALDVTTSAVSGIALLENKQGVEILSAHHCLLDDSLTRRDAVAEIIEECGTRPDRCLVSVGVEQFHFRLLNLPFSDLKKVRSVVPFEIEDSVSLQDEPFVFDYLLQPRDDGTTDVFGVIVREKIVTQLINGLSEHGLEPEVITVSALPSAFNLIRRKREGATSFALLHVDMVMTSLVIVIENEIKSIRSIPCRLTKDDTSEDELQAMHGTGKLPEYTGQALIRLGSDIRYSLIAAGSLLPEGVELPFVFEGSAGRIDKIRGALCAELGCNNLEPTADTFEQIKNIETLDEHPLRGCFDAVIALACCKPKDRDRINFCEDDFALFGQNTTYARIAKYAAVAVAVVVLGTAVFQAEHYRSMKVEQAELIRQVEKLYLETVPDSVPGPDPVKQLQVKVRDLNDASATGTIQNPSIDVVKVLADISARVPTSMEVSFERFIYDRKNIRVRGLTDNFNTVDQMKNRLAESPLFAEVAIGSANVDQKGDGVRFELKMEL